MPNRRDFIKGVAGAAAGAWVARRAFTGDALAQNQGQGQAQGQGRGGRGGGGGQQAQPSGPVVRREVRIGNKRVKVIDVHSHASIPEVATAMQGTPFGRGGGGRPLGQDRIDELDKRGIDFQVFHVNMFGWYAADHDTAAKLIDVQDNGLAAWCKAHPDRFGFFSSPALQFPDLAAQQLQHAVKDLGGLGGAIGGHVMGETLSDAKFDPFWAKAQELDVPIFMHPNGANNLVKEDGFKGRADLQNIIGNPLETTLFLSHLIYDGVFDKFPNLKVIAAHAGGYLPSYETRSEVAGEVRANADCLNKKKPSAYLKTQIYIDSMLFTPEAIRHLVAEMGASQIVYGTDIPLVWPDTVDDILNAEISDADKEAILGGNATKLLHLKA
jgi:aminocarboxymuconate-semialdehyde decarboxylase